VTRIPPPTSDKIKANQLSSDSETMLLAGMRKSKSVEGFLRNFHDVTLGDRVASTFKSEYSRLKSDGLGPDAIFAALWRFAGGTARGSVSDESAVLAVLAYLFERCEIFESAGEDGK
jgi:hypothetical protein